MLCPLTIHPLGSPTYLLNHQRCLSLPFSPLLPTPSLAVTSGYSGLHAVGLRKEESGDFQRLDFRPQRGHLPSTPASYCSYPPSPSGYMSVVQWRIPVDAAQAAAAARCSTLPSECLASRPLPCASVAHGQLKAFWSAEEKEAADVTWWWL